MQHENLAAGKWFELSLAEQLGNIGSEVGRAESWSRRGNQEYVTKATERMLELLDLSIADERWAGSKRNELTRVREALCDSFYGQQQMGGSMESWNRYFMPFAILARTQKGQ
jgi:hypothetical protein